ncbi:hypothetical protein ACQP2F_28820 [Actinoplanes sp. CA-030573]|uniref:hypothetical protein n=1 Tax=Actinoplanes sp. CA-030573 TaxID=3239898 RepID=UPI003D8DC004
MHLAAPSEQGGSSLTLVIAILGIVGTLTAAFVTQWLSARRDDKQWQRQKQLQDERFDRERDEEAARWERERRERQEQWKREDSARLHQARLGAYETLLATLDGAREVISNVSLRARSATDVEKAFDAMHDALLTVGEPRARVDILGSPAVVGAMRAAIAAINDYAECALDEMLDTGPGDSDARAARRSHQLDLLTAWRLRMSDLRNSIRRDIGNEPIDEMAGLGNRRPREQTGLSGATVHPGNAGARAG